jgi:hypothetical protein
MLYFLILKKFLIQLFSFQILQTGHSPVLYHQTSHLFPGHHPPGEPSSVADPGSGEFFDLWIRDPGIFLALDLGQKKFGSGINILDP